MKNLFLLWHTGLTIQVRKNLISNKGDMVLTAGGVVMRAFSTLMIVNLVFYITEKIIFGHAFVHYGDYILMAYLATEIIWSLKIIYLLRQEISSYVYLNA